MSDHLQAGDSVVVEAISTKKNAQTVRPSTPLLIRRKHARRNSDYVMINPLDGVKIALGALKVNVLRALLTMLGIVIGVGAVIVMVAVGSGAREMIGEQIRSIGSNLILVIPGATVQGGARLGSGSVHTLKSTDAEAIIRECSAVKTGGPKLG